MFNKNQFSSFDAAALAAVDAKSGLDSFHDEQLKIAYSSLYGPERDPVGSPRGYVNARLDLAEAFALHRAFSVDSGTYEELLVEMGDYKHADVAFSALNSYIHHIDKFAARFCPNTNDDVGYLLTNFRLNALYRWIYDVLGPWQEDSVARDLASLEAAVAIHSTTLSSVLSTSSDARAAANVIKRWANKRYVPNLYINLPEFVGDTDDKALCCKETPVKS